MAQARAMGIRIRVILKRCFKVGSFPQGHPVMHAPEGADGLRPTKFE